jgi:RNA polymerase sigma-70 factor (ECF subfamily)
VAQDIGEQLTALMPRMRVWAMAMTRNHAAAADLTQEVATRAWNAQRQFLPDTNFPAWIRRIMVNTSISSVRAKRETTDVMPELAVPASGEHHVALREIGREVARLPADQRDALLMVALEEISYEDAAARTGCAIGTMKSRVHRARQHLRDYATGAGVARLG